MRGLHLPIGLIKKEVPLVQGKAVESFGVLLKQAVRERNPALL